MAKRARLNSHDWKLPGLNVALSKIHKGYPF
jgi:hypothetical protein